MHIDTRDTRKYTLGNTRKYTVVWKPCKYHQILKYTEIHAKKIHGNTRKYTHQSEHRQTSKRVHPTFKTCPISFIMNFIHPFKCWSMKTLHAAQCCLLSACLSPAKAPFQWRHHQGTRGRCHSWSCNSPRQKPPRWTCGPVLSYFLFLYYYWCFIFYIIILMSRCSCSLL